jgi:hypothetical protein
MCCKSDVFPLPKKPEMTVIGIMGLAMAILAADVAAAAVAGLAENEVTPMTWLRLRQARTLVMAPFMAPICKEEEAEWSSQEGKKDDKEKVGTIGCGRTHDRRMDYGPLEEAAKANATQANWNDTFEN